MAPSEVVAKTESPPTQVVATVVEMMVTAVATDENPSSNGVVAGGEGEATEGGVDKELGGADAKVTVLKKRGKPRKHKRDKNATMLISPSFFASLTPLAQKRGEGGLKAPVKFKCWLLLGHFELLTLSGSYSYSETGVAGVQCKIGRLNISPANPDERVFVGAVAGSVIAAGPIQLILASFQQSIKKQLPMRHSAESSTAASMQVESDIVRVLTLIDKT